MNQALRRRVAEENIAFFGGAADPELVAVQVAIHLEDALGTTLPAEVVDAAHLGSRAALEATLDELFRTS